MDSRPSRVNRFLSSVLLGILLVMPFQTSSALAFELTLKTPEDFETRLTNASLLFAAKEEGMAEPQDIVATAQAEYRRMVGVLYSDGYFGPDVSVLIDGREAATLPPFENIGQVRQVEIRVDPGPQFRFGQISIDPLAPETELPESFRQGESARTGAITQAASAAVKGWRDDGYAKASLSSESIIADHRDSTLDVDIGLEPGPKLRFGDLTISGTSKMTEDRLVDIISLPSGETFSPHDLDRISKRLRRTGVFRSVSITEADAIGPDGTLDIDVRLEDEKPRRITFGAELESTDGLSVSGSWIHRNLFGGGERLVIDGEVSGIGGTNDSSELIFGALLTRPATFQPDTDFTFGIKLESIDNDIYQINKFGITTGLKRLVSDELTVSGGLLLEASNSDDDYGSRQFRTVGLPIRAIWDLRDDQLDPKSGYFVSGTFMPYAATKDGAPGLFMFGDGRTYRRFGDSRLTGAVRLQLGSIVGPSLAETPPDYLFLSGGGGTVRGQPYESNFVTVNGLRSGGLSFIGISGELRYRTTETIEAVAFYDAGFVGETSNPFDDGEWHSGAGFGIRYITTIGPIRVDVGFPVSGDNSEGTQLYVGIGQAF